MKRKPNTKSRTKSPPAPSAEWKWLADAGGPVIVEDQLEHVRMHGVEVLGTTWETQMRCGRTWHGSLYLHRSAPWDSVTSDTVRFEILEMGEYLGWTIMRARSDPNGEFDDFDHAIELDCGWSETIEEVLEALDVGFQDSPGFFPSDWVQAGRDMDGMREQCQSTARREMEWRLSTPAAIASRAAARPSSAARAPKAAPRAPKQTPQM
ncbi:MAG: hypothetical protein ABI702_06110 [Burkholderiales bacterium]